MVAGSLIISSTIGSSVVMIVAMPVPVRSGNENDTGTKRHRDQGKQQHFFDLIHSSFSIGAFLAE